MLTEIKNCKVSRKASVKETQRAFFIQGEKINVDKIFERWVEEGLMTGNERDTSESKGVMGICDRL